jgi:hypothetical protein
MALALQMICSLDEKYHHDLWIIVADADADADVAWRRKFQCRLYN